MKYVEEIIEIVEFNPDCLSHDEVIAEVQKIMDAYATSMIQELIKKLQSQQSKN